MGKRSKEATGARHLSLSRMAVQLALDGVTLGIDDAGLPRIEPRVPPKPKGKEARRAGSSRLAGLAGRRDFACILGQTGSKKYGCQSELTRFPGALLAFPLAFGAMTRADSLGVWL